jgi:DNA-binding beta-propeller fold protein YncE
MDRSPIRSHRLLLIVGFGIASAINVAPVQAQELCGGIDYPFPYTDVSGVGAAFCPGIMEAYVTGVSKGTTPTTFSPNETVTRVQMTTFLQRSLDQGLTRGSRRAALNQWWVPQNTHSMQTITFATAPFACAGDGENIWTLTSDGRVTQIQASTGISVNHWTGAAPANAVLVAAGKIFITGVTSPGSLYVIDPTQAPGTVTTAASNLGGRPDGIAFDGTNLWTANQEPPGSGVSIITPQPPYSVTTVSAGFNEPRGILYDGAHIWVTDVEASTLLKLDSSGNILQTVQVGNAPELPVFDGANIWVPNGGDNSITVVQASTGDVVATITQDASNQLDIPFSASFDGERVLVTNYSGNSVTVFKAADLSFIANVSTGSGSGYVSACSDGINFWLPTNSGLLRF